MSEDIGRAPSGQALVSDQAATRLDPAGFDPSRGARPRCQCDEAGILNPAYADWYDAELELPFVNHAPGECECVNDLAQYRTGDTIRWLCSCCFTFGDVRLRDSDGSREASETRSGSTEGDSADPKGIAQ